MTFSPIRGAGTNNGYTNTAVAFPAQDGAQTMVVRELNARVRQEAAYLQDLLAEINKVMVGQEELVERVLIALLADGHFLPRFHQDIPTRFAVIPRRGTTEQIRWFEADPTFVLHFVNAYEDGDSIVIDGFHQSQPEPSGEGITDKWLRAYRYLSLDLMQTHLHRWRLDLATGTVTEQRLSDSFTEFGMMNPLTTGRRHRFAYAATAVPGRFLFDGLVKHDVEAGTEERISFGEGVFGSETVMAPRVGSTGEDDGYLVTFVTDMNQDASFCFVYAAQSPSEGPLCVLRLPERISSGTHSTWVAGSEIRRWHTADEAPAAVGL